MQTTPIILSNFQDYYLTEPVEQIKLMKHLAYMMASAQCIYGNINSKEDANVIYKNMLENIDRYSVSPDLIQSRQYNFLPLDKYKNLSSTLPHEQQLEMAMAENESEEKSQSPFSSHLKLSRHTINNSTTKSGNNIKQFSYTHTNFLENPCGLSVDKRMKLYDISLNKILGEIYKIKEDLPDTVLHTTCTGYISPSPIQSYLSNNNWLRTQVIHAYQMGCYAAIPSVNLAVGLVSASHNSLAKPIKLDVVHTEMSSLHLDVVNTSPGNIVNMTLFGDGFIKYSVTAENDFKKLEVRGLKILAVETILIKNSLNEMSLTPGPFQFDIFISKNVPLLIGANIYDFMKKICNQVNLNFDKIKDELHYAIHPGGPKIVNYIQETLKLDNSRMSFSRDVFYRFGNMVSATLPYVWKDIVSSNAVNLGEKIISVAFGPGLTVTGTLFEKI